MDNEQKQQTALVEWNRAGSAMAKCIASWDLTTPEGKRKAFNAMQGQDFNAADVIGTVLPVEDVLIHPCVITNPDTGEEKPSVRTVFILEDGGRVATQSDYVPRAVARLVDLYGQPPWKPALSIKVVNPRGSRGRDFYTLELA